MIDEFTFTERTAAERGFAQVFQDQIVPILDTRGREFLRRRRNLIMGAGGIAVLGVMAGVSVGASSGDQLKAAVVTMACWIVALGIAVYQEKMWRNRLGADILPIVARFLGDTVYGQREIAIDDFTSRGLVPAHDHAEIEDPVVGRYRDLRWAMAEARLRRRRQARGGRSVRFQGLLMKIEILGPAPRVLFLNSGSAFRRGIDATLNPRWAGLDLITTGLDAFDAQVATYAADRAAALRFIDARFADGLMEVIRPTGNSPAMAGLQGSWLYLAIPRSGEFLSFGSLWRPAARLEDELHRVIEDLTLPRRIIDTLRGG